MRVAAFEHHQQLRDISLAPAKAGRERKRHRPQPGIDRAEEKGGEFGSGLGHQGDAIAGGEAERDEAAGVGERIVAQGRIRISVRQGPARVVEIHSARSTGGIIERVAERFEIGETARQSVAGGRCAVGGNVGHRRNILIRNVRQPLLAASLCVMVAECGTNMAMRDRKPRPPRQPRRPRPPLDEAALKELALSYVARFATSRAKLGHYLRRKVHERGWENERDAPIAQIVERLAEAGYIDDPAYALSKARTLGARGFGERRVSVELRVAGIEEEDGAAARDLAREGAREAALRFAKRKHIGPFSATPPDRRDSDKALAAMMRAGHPFDLAKHVLSLPADFDPEA